MKLITCIFGCALMLGASLASAQTNPSPATIGRDSGSVTVTAASPAQGAPGSPVNVQVDYAGLPKSGVTVRYRTEGALTLVSTATKQLTPDGNGASQDTVVVRAPSAGVYFLNVFTSAKGVTRVVSIPVTVGNAMLKPRAASSVATPGGERVIETPAQQTVR